MKLDKIRIKNFRSFRDETVNVDSYTCLVGPNGSGKSTILTALNLFFRDPACPTNMLILCKEDFHHGNTAEPVEITLTFKDLSAQAQEDLKHYYRQNQLVVMARSEWDEESQSAEVKQYGIRNVMKEFAPYFKAVSEKEKAAKLKEIYDDIQKTFSDLCKATSGTARETALREYEEKHPELCSPVQSEAQFFGFTKGSNLLEKYVKWVYLPAVKDATTEQSETGRSALKELLDRTVRSRVNFKEPIAKLRQKTEEAYQQMVDAEKETLSELQDSLHSRLCDWYTPNAKLRLGWHCDGGAIKLNEPSARAELGEDNFIGEVVRLGHGMQRSFIITMLHELATLNSVEGPTLVLGFEEPELYQHPPQAQHMSSVLEELAESTKTNTQVIVSTHSPYFISSKGFENVRVVRKHHVDKCSLVAETTFSAVEAAVAAALGAKPDMPNVIMSQVEQIMQPSQRELYFCRVAVLVEGLEDVGFIGSHLVLNGHWREFRRLGCHFIVVNGKRNMSRPLAIANELCIKTFLVFDSDSDRTNDLNAHRQDNLCLLRLSGNDGVDPLLADALMLDNCAIFGPRIADAVQAEAGDLWAQCSDTVRNAGGFIHGNKKNKMFVSAVMQELHSNRFCSQLLNELWWRIKSFAEGSRREPVQALLNRVPDAKAADGDAVAVAT